MPEVLSMRPEREATKSGKPKDGGGEGEKRAHPGEARGREKEEDCPQKPDGDKGSRQGGRKA